jgi:hypothetical protein
MDTIFGLVIAVIMTGDAGERKAGDTFITLTGASESYETCVKVGQEQTNALVASGAPLVALFACIEMDQSATSRFGEPL